MAADLNQIRATQQKLIAAKDSSKLPGDESLIELALAKRQLLDWAETRLQTFGREATPEALTNALSKELDAVLIPVREDKEMDFLGGMGVEFSRPTGELAWLQMSTVLGVQCGSDRSVYLYEWRENRWNRRFAMEIDDYQKDRYGPKNSVELQVSAPDSRGARLVLATAWPPHCTSLWHSLYIQLFRFDASQTLLWEAAPLANTGEDPAHSRLEPGGALVEFSGASIDSGIFIRKYVLHYAAEGVKVRRIEPIAVSARDFVDEWLRNSWAEMEPWSNPSFAAWHKRLHTDSVSGGFSAVRQCVGSGDWQVAIDIRETTYYFFVNDRGGYRFRMSGAGEQPRSDCTGPNQVGESGDSQPTLFPGK
jgi:hypothetical protein